MQVKMGGKTFQTQPVPMTLNPDYNNEVRPIHQGWAYFFAQSRLPEWMVPEQYKIESRKDATGNIMFEIWYWLYHTYFYIFVMHYLCGGLLNALFLLMYALKVFLSYRMQGCGHGRWRLHWKVQCADREDHQR